MPATPKQTNPSESSRFDLERHSEIIAVAIMVRLLELLTEANLLMAALNELVPDGE